MTFGAIAVGYTGFRYLPSLIPEKLTLEAMDSPAGFRKFVAGETSAGSFSPFVGLESADDIALREAKFEADARVENKICEILYAGLDLDSGHKGLTSHSTTG